MKRLKDLKKIRIDTFLYILSFLILNPQNAKPDTHFNDIFPERIILNITGDPSHSQAVTWRTKNMVIEPLAQITLAIDSPDLEKHAGTKRARTENVNIGSNKTSFQHSVILDSLQPNTLYAYRVGSRGKWSEWNQFKTAKENFSPFKIIYFGDPQTEITDYVSRIFRTAYSNAPNAAFMLFAGDLVNNGSADNEWEELFYAAGWIPGTMPSIMLPGNHSYLSKKLSPLWRAHFTLPENGPAGLEETTYHVDYQGVRFIMLNGNEKLTEQAVWLDSILSNNSNQWTVAAIHQPIYSTGQKRDEVKLRKAFLPVFDKYTVDIVLQGHDHTYGRSHKLYNGDIVPENRNGTIYVVSVSGPKVYTVNEKFKHLFVKIGNNVQLFQVLEFKEKQIHFKAITASGKIYDEFVITKNENK